MIQILEKLLNLEYSLVPHPFAGLELFRLMILSSVE